jgi:hypothetical protein
MIFEKELNQTAKHVKRIGMGDKWFIGVVDAWEEKPIDFKL